MPINRTVLEGLLERVKAATGPDRELDCRLQVLANGGTGMFRDADAWTKAAIEQDWNVPRNTASVEGAIVLVERMLGGWDFNLSPDKPGGPYTAEMIWPDGALTPEGAYFPPVGRGATRPLAILAGLLDALLTTSTEGADHAPALRTPITDGGRAEGRAPEGTGWQPIETAPKDGTAVLLWSGIVMRAGWWAASDDVWRIGGDSILRKATHWRPLPPAPGRPDPNPRSDPETAAVEMPKPRREIERREP